MLFFLQPLRFHPVEEPEPDEEEEEEEEEEEVEAEFVADEVTDPDEPFDDHEVESGESSDEDEESSLAYAAIFDAFAAEVEAETEPEEE